MNEYAEALQKLNEEYAEKGVNSPTRSKWMLMSALMHVDAFKIQHHPGREALTEKEFLELAKRAYWETREKIQAEPTPEMAAAPPAAPAVEVVKSCDNCQNRCMDMEMDPYCAAVNRPFGRMLASGKPLECGSEFKLWERDTRGQ